MDAQPERVITHEYGCKCEQCRAMIAAILATDSRGYFFTDEELRGLASDGVKGEKNG
jgi:hypothetical protein